MRCAREGQGRAAEPGVLGLVQGQEGWRVGEDAGEVVDLEA